MGTTEPSDTPTDPPEASGSLVADGTGVTASGDAQAVAQNGAKAARRNRAALVTTALVASALVLGLMLTTWQAIRASRAEPKASRAPTTNRDSRCWR